MGKVVKIVNASKRSGEKNGKTWNIMSVEVEDNGKTVVADTFDKVEVGTEVVVIYDEKYKSYSAKLASSKSAQTDSILVKLDNIEKKLDTLLDTSGVVSQDVWS